MENRITVTRARHNWPEKAGFCIDRPEGMRSYIFIHFHNSVELLVGGKRIRTEPNTWILYDLDTPQWYKSTEPLRHDWMHMTGPLPQLLEAVGLKLDTAYTLTDSRYVTAILRELELELLTKPVYHQQLMELKCRELFTKLARSCAREQLSVPMDRRLTERLWRVRKDIFSQPEKQWTVADMAALAYISPSRFHTVYRMAFGVSPMDDLIRARIDMAKNRLCSAEMTVQRLAEELGYRNVTHFCRQFKQITGLTPSQFRASPQE